MLETNTAQIGGVDSHAAQDQGRRGGGRKRQRMTAKAQLLTEGAQDRGEPNFVSARWPARAPARTPDLPLRWRSGTSPSAHPLPTIVGDAPCTGHSGVRRHHRRTTATVERRRPS